MQTSVELSARSSLWWAALCAVSAVNILAWAVGAWRLRRLAGSTVPEHREARRWQLALSAVFVAVCAFRSVFPRADVQRICLHDTFLSSVALGRSLATIAELCFVAQWALFLRQLARRTGGAFAEGVSRAILPLIVVAETCSWYAVLSTSYIGNSLEESIWAVTALLTTLAAASLLPRLPRSQRPLLAGGIAFGLAYVAFMVTVDVPMYVGRFLADQADHRPTLTLAQGIRDVMTRWVVTSSWEAWRTEVPWMTLYFSVTVWASIAFAHLPPLSARAAGGQLVPRPARLPIQRLPGAGRLTV